MDINKKVMTMEEDTYELVKQASATYGYSKDLEERLHLCLLSHMYKKYREEVIDYNDLLNNIEYQTTTVPVIYNDDLEEYSAITEQTYMNRELINKTLIYGKYGKSGSTIEVSSLYHELEHLLTSFHCEYDKDSLDFVDRTGLQLVKMSQLFGSVEVSNEFINEAITLNEELKLPKIVSDLSNYSLKLINIDALKRLVPSSSQIMRRSGYKNIYNLVKPMIDIMANEINEIKYYGDVKDFEDSYDKLIEKRKAFRKLSKSVDSFHNLERGSTKLSNKWFTKDYYVGKINSNMNVLKEKAYQKRKVVDKHGYK